MRVRGTNKDNDEIKLNMTAMIDIVFQLLIFFIMTFKIVAMEGDFNIKMPLATSNASAIDEILPTVVRVKLTAGDGGKIASINADNGMEGETFSDADMYLKLTEFVERTMAGETDPSTTEETEVEFELDFNLKYAYFVKAIEAVSGRVEADGSVKKLIEKFKLKSQLKQSELLP